MSFHLLNLVDSVFCTFKLSIVDNLSSVKQSVATMMNQWQIGT